MIAVSRVPGEFVFVTAPEGAELPSRATVAEREGVSHLLRREDADRLGHDHDGFVAAWLTVDGQTSLDAIGITAALSAALAARSIPCNVIAGRHHDHLLVPVDRVDEAVDALRGVVPTWG